MKKNNMIIIAALLVILAGAGGFFAGMKYQQNKQSASRQFTMQGGRNNFGGNRTNMRPVAGEIISSDASSITVKLADGSSKIVMISDKTTINKAATGTKDDLKTGSRVAAFGTENSDGSVTASNIQLNPINGAMGRPTPNQTP